jgi:hypothetical protein
MFNKARLRIARSNNYLIEGSTLNDVLFTAISSNQNIMMGFIDNSNSILKLTNDSCTERYTEYKYIATKWI